jgi:thiamine biosynthesis lipoprotein
MPLAETLPAGTDCAQWTVWGTVARIVVTDRRARDAARAVVESELAAVDQACSRFRADSELVRLAIAAGRPAHVSDRLASLIAAALRAAGETDGDVDPTIGGALCALGYDRDFAALTQDGTDGHPDFAALTHYATDGDRGAGLAVYPAATWRDVTLHGNELTIPRGVRLDLGATAKAWAADRGAALASAACDTGIMVALGGDIATAGPAPEGGWQVLVKDGPDQPEARISLPAGAALATSSTIARSWRDGTRTLHHILDPRSGRPASRVWRTVSVAGSSCLRANTRSTAAIVRGATAERWLTGLNAPARLVSASGAIHRTGGWPVEREGVAS